MPSGFKRDRLRQRGRTRRHRALPVEDAEIPADRLGGFLGAVADAAGAAVVLVGRDIDDELLALRLRAAGRAGPARDRRRRLRDVVLRHLSYRHRRPLAPATMGSATIAAEASKPRPTKRSFDIPVPPFRDAGEPRGSSGRLRRRFSDGRCGRRNRQASEPVEAGRASPPGSARPSSAPSRRGPVARPRAGAARRRRARSR